MTHQSPNRLQPFTFAQVSPPEVRQGLRHWFEQTMSRPRGGLFFTPDDEKKKIRPTQSGETKGLRRKALNFATAPTRAGATR
jgi:hypothetical protein